MYAIATLLDPPSDQAVRILWERFEEHCGLTGIRITPLPHFSWQAADAYQLGPVEMILEQLAGEMKPFTVRTAGLGIFTGAQPVVYVSLVKDELLLNIHKVLWEKVRPYAAAPNMYYDPARWVPHITLAFKEIEPERLGCAVADIAFQRISMEIVVDHFAVIYQAGGIAGMHNRFVFNESIQPIGGYL